MSWTSPMTFTTGAVLTAAQMNTFLRDNLLETAPAKATTSGGYFVSTGANAIAERVPASAIVLADQSTSSINYVDLTTVGPAVTVVTGQKALVSLYADMYNETAERSAAASFDVTGATTIGTSSARELYIDGIAASNHMKIGATFMLDTLNPGSNTFTMRYRTAGAGGDVAHFLNRQIIVLPL